VTWNFLWRSSVRRRTGGGSLFYAAFLVVADDHVGQDRDEHVSLSGSDRVVLGPVNLSSARVAVAGRDRVVARLRRPYVFIERDAPV
jgi:hypothetical protein